MAVRDHGRRRWCRRSATALVAGWVVSQLAIAGAAQAADKNAVLVLDANSGRTLYQTSADAPRYPASLTKMMTLYLVFELIEQGRLSYQTRIKMSATAVAVAPSKLDLDEGDDIALIDAIKVLITKSANDVAVAVAEHIAGSEEKFARLMTQKAHQLGMTATTFRNASGLPDDQQLTTARDIVTLALRLQDDFPRHYPLFATRTFTYKDETFRNHNSLLFNYPGTDGLKTGYTRASGFNLIASVRRGNKHVIGVVFGGASASSRNTALRTFLNMGLVKASSERSRKPAPQLIARPKPAPAPKVATVPTPQRVERPLPKPPAVPPAETAAAPPARALPPAIEIARVRPVLVAPRTPTLQPAEAGGDSQAISIETLLQAEAPHRADARMADATPTTLPPQWASASAAPQMRLSAAAPPDRPALFSQPLPTRGAPPSTLEQQAHNLARGAPPISAPAPAAAVQAPTPQPAVRPNAWQATAAAGGFQIQIGAFQNATEAERQLAAARKRAGGALANRAPVTLQVQQAGKVFYRARFTGFEAQTAAASACGELKRLKIDCLVMKAE